MAQPLRCHERVATLPFRSAVRCGRVGVLRIAEVSLSVAAARASVGVAPLLCEKMYLRLPSHG